MGKGNQEIDNFVGSILQLIGRTVKEFVKGVFQGCRRLNSPKKVLLFLITFLVPAVTWLNKEMLFLVLPENMPKYLEEGIYYMLLSFPVLTLWFLGQGKKENYEENFKEIGFKGKDGKYPVFCGKNKEGRKNILIFKSTISLSEWKAERERLETALDCNIFKMENGKNKRVVKLTTLPSDYQIPTMIDWNEEYLNPKNGVMSVGMSALEIVRFDLNKVPHVLVAGETGSGKSVILRCLLWQMILQGARVYMIDFKGGVEFGKQYEQYGEVITERKRALEVLEFLVIENEHRLRLFRELEVKNLGEYNRKTKQNLCRIGVFTDELAEMLDKKGVAKEEKAVYEMIEGKLSTLARLSRATGINLFMGVQRPDANVLTGQIKNNIPVRISGRFADKTASEIVLGNTDAVTLPEIKGRFLYKVGNETIEFQSFYFDDDRMLKEVSMEQGDMLTEAPAYNFRPETAQDNRKASPGEQGTCKEQTAGREKTERKTKEGTVFGKHPGRTRMDLDQIRKKNSVSDFDENKLEEEMRRMDEEDLNLDFGNFE